MGLWITHTLLVTAGRCRSPISMMIYSLESWEATGRDGPSMFGVYLKSNESTAKLTSGKDRA